MARKDVNRSSINMEWDAVKPLSKNGYAPKDAVEEYINLKGE